MSLAFLALLGFLLGFGASGHLTRASCGKALLAIACGAVLLFPVVSASDDLHPTQAVLEDASKRVQLGVAPFHLLSASPPLFVPPATLAISLRDLIIPQLSRTLSLKARELDRAAIPSAGRAPPFFHCN